MKSLRTLIVGCALVLVPLAAQAQEEGGGGSNGVAAQKKSISFGIPNGGNGYASGAIAPWMMVSPTINLGINVGLAFGNKPDTNYDLLIGPAIRYYLMTSGDVLPYVHAQLNFRFYDDGVSGNKDDPELSLAGGMGAEWFITDVFSLAGHFGLGIDVLRKGGSDAGIRLGTFTSGLTGQIYW